MDEKRTRVLVDVLSLLLLAVLAADFAWVIRTALAVRGGE